MAQDDSDIDLLVDFPGQSAGEQLMNAAGLSVELGELLGVGVDVLVLEFARPRVAESISQRGSYQPERPVASSYMTSGEISASLGQVNAPSTIPT